MFDRPKVGAFALTVIAFLAASGISEAQNKCAGAKIKAACKKMTCKGGLEARQAQTGGTIDPAKVAKCESKFSSTFAKNEAKGGCPTTGDTVAVEAKIDAFILDLDTELNLPTPPPQNRCEAAKIKAAAKKADCKCKLEAKQAQKGGTIDPAKVAKCESKFSSSFAKAESYGGCNTTGDAAVIEGKVDAFVADVDTELTTTPTTTTTAATTSTTATTTSTTALTTSTTAATTSTTEATTTTTAATTSTTEATTTTTGSTTTTTSTTTSTTESTTTTTSTTTSTTESTTSTTSTTTSTTESTTTSTTTLPCNPEEPSCGSTCGGNGVCRLHCGPGCGVGECVDATTFGGLCDADSDCPPPQICAGIVCEACPSGRGQCMTPCP